MAALLALPLTVKLAILAIAIIIIAVSVGTKRVEKAELKQMSAEATGRIVGFQDWRGVTSAEKKHVAPRGRGSDAAYLLVYEYTPPGDKQPIRAYQQEPARLIDDLGIETGSTVVVRYDPTVHGYSRAVVSRGNS
jgi:hypothetical protein